MKRSAILIVGLSVLVPYVVGVLTQVTPADLDIDVGQRGLAARTVGLVPGFLAETISGKVGVAGAVLLGFLALSALTLVTFAWHPLQRLEAGGRGGTAAGGPADGGTGGTGAKRVGRAHGEASEGEREPSRRIPAAVLGERSAVPPSRRPAGGAGAASPQEGQAAEPAAGSSANEESDTPPIELLTAPRERGHRRRARRSSTGWGSRCWRRSGPSRSRARSRGGPPGPVVTQFEVVPAPGVKAGRIVALADDLAMAMRAPSIRVAPIPGKGAVGVEVPNPIARMVTLRELIESPRVGQRAAPRCPSRWAATSRASRSSPTSPRCRTC